MTDDLKQMPDELWIRRTYAGAGRGQRFTGVEVRTRINDCNSNLGRRVKYLRADTITAPEKIDGAQEAYNTFVRNVNCYDYEPDIEHVLGLNTVETIKRALIQAGAVDK